MIGIIVTTFLRDNLLLKCLTSIKKYWNENYYLIVIDQGTSSSYKDDFITEYFKTVNGEYIRTSFDVGPLKARNIAVKKIQELNIPYTLMSADSILFTKNYDFTLITEFLEQEPSRFLCSFDIINRIT